MRERLILSAILIVCGALTGLAAAAVALPRMADDWFWKRWMLLKRAQIK